MIISGKKIVTLTGDERQKLMDAEDVLEALKEALGNDEFYDFAELIDIIYQIRHTDKFEMDFEDVD